MTKLFLAGIGGFVGSVLRYSVGGLLVNVSRRFEFPCGTLAVNVTGCLAIGLLSYLAETRGIFNAETRTLVFVGLLGGFTTFSAFGNETMSLWREGHGSLALVNVVSHLVLCLGAVWCGRAVAYQIWS